MTTTVRWIAALTIAIVLVQAALIGQALSIPQSGASQFTLHGYLGNASFVGAIVLAGLAVVATRRGQLPTAAATLGVLLAVLMVAQIGLGYSGRGGGWPAALHVPNGVLIAGVLASLLTLTLIVPRQRESGP